MGNLGRYRDDFARDGFRYDGPTAAAETGISRDFGVRSQRPSFLSDIFAVYALSKNCASPAKNARWSSFAFYSVEALQYVFCIFHRLRAPSNRSVPSR